MNQFFMQFLVGLIANWKIQPCFLIYNAFIMCEGIKASFSVISSHTAGSETSESHFTGSKMDNGVVDTSSSEAAARKITSGLRSCQM